MKKWRTRYKGYDIKFEIKKGMFWVIVVDKTDNVAGAFTHFEDAKDWIEVRELSSTT